MMGPGKQPWRVSGYFSEEEKAERGRGDGSWEGLQIPLGLQWGLCGPRDGVALSGAGPAGITGDNGRPQVGCGPRCVGPAPRAAPGPGEDRVVVGSGASRGLGLQGDAGKSSRPPPAVSAWLGSWLRQWRDSGQMVPWATTGPAEVPAGVCPRGGLRAAPRLGRG